jgi:hypothetical protein
LGTKRNSETGRQVEADGKVGIWAGGQAGSSRHASRHEVGYAGRAR